MAKLNQFKGKLDFQRDSPQKISQTLSNLETYLQQYEEADAAKIVEELKAKATGEKSHSEKLLGKQFLKEYAKRTQTLEDISKNIKKIQADLIDEQDTSLSKKPKKGKITGKIRSGFDKVKGAASKVVDKSKGLFDNLMSLGGGLLNGIGALQNLLPLLAGGAVSFMLGGLGLLAGKIVHLATRSLKWIVKTVTKIGFRIAKMAVKASWWVGKATIKVIGKMGSLLWHSAKLIGVGVGRGLKLMQTLMASVWTKLKNAFSKGPTKSPKPSGTPEKGGKAKNPVEGKKPSKSPKPSGSISDKIKNAIKGVQTSVLKHAGKLGGVGKALIGGLPKVLAKVTPFGLPFLAYDAYHAYSKSNSLTSFGVNFVNETLGGLIGFSADNPEAKENPGAWVDKMIFGENSADPEVQGSSTSVANSVTAVTKGIQNLPNNSPVQPSIESAMQALASMGSTGTVSSSDMEELVKFKDNPWFIWVVNQIQQGKMTAAEAVRKLKSGEFKNHLASTTVHNDVEIHDSQYVMLEEVKNQAVAESTLISSQMNKSVLGALQTTNSMMLGQIHNTSINQGTVVNQYLPLTKHAVQG